MLNKYPFDAAIKGLTAQPLQWPFGVKGLKDPIVIQFWTRLLEIFF
jgi:hypothetical protein